MFIERLYEALYVQPRFRNTWYFIFILGMLYTLSGNEVIAAVQ